MSGRRCRWPILAVALLLPLPAMAEADPGQRIYRDGVRISGAPLSATLANGVRLQGADAACVKCHRRSGLGSSEGRTTVRPISGKSLFEPPPQPDTRHPTSPYGVVGTRPVYTLESFSRALRVGINSAGAPMDALMPRFDLSDREIRHLAAYLQGLSAAPDPGVTEREIHFATILTDDVSPGRRAALLETMAAFVRGKNGGTRQEERRRTLGSEQMYRTYRSWVMHVWELTGPPQGWRQQLQEHYRKQPVFAVVGGAGGGEWRPVHEFCEESALPCVFPVVDFPVVAGAGHYSVYFSQGVMLEAEALASYLADKGRGGGIVQVFRDDELGRMPARALRQALLSAGGGPVVDRPVSGRAPPGKEFWAELLRADRPSRLVVWLNKEDIRALGGSQSPPEFVAEAFFSASLLASDKPPLPAEWLERARLLYPFALPESRAQSLRLMKSWLRIKQIPLREERAQADTFFALSVVGDVLSHMLGHFSREYFLERIERMTEVAAFYSVYPRLSLGPDQRFASRGSYVVGFAGEGGDALQPLSDWIIP